MPKPNSNPNGQEYAEIALAGGVICRPETREDRILMLLNRAKSLQRGSRNPFKNNFREYLRHCCWTKDEARGGKVAKIPDWPMIDEYADALILCPKIMFEKSRRVLASWVVCCFDLWIAAGGQDPRWEQLLLGDSNRQVIIASRKFEGLQGSNWFLRERVKFIYEQFEKQGARDLWPDFPYIEWIEGEGRCSNGSRITAAAQGADQLRGPGATLIHLEELAFWEQAQQSVEGALPVVRGGGHVVAITTPNAASYAKRVVDGSLSNPNWIA